MWLCSIWPGSRIPSFLSCLHPSSATWSLHKLLVCSSHRPLIPAFITLYYFCLSSVLYPCIHIFILVLCSQCHKSFLCPSVLSSVISYYAVYSIFSSFCPKSTLTTHNTSNLPALFSRCDHHGLVFSFFLSPLHARIVLIAFSYAPHQTRGYTPVFFLLL